MDGFNLPKGFIPKENLELAMLNLANYIAEEKMKAWNSGFETASKMAVKVIGEK